MRLDFPAMAAGLIKVNLIFFHVRVPIPVEDEHHAETQKAHRI